MDWLHFEFGVIMKHVAIGILENAIVDVVPVPWNTFIEELLGHRGGPWEAEVEAHGHQWPTAPAHRPETPGLMWVLTRPPCQPLC